MFKRNHYRRNAVLGNLARNRKPGISDSITPGCSKLHLRLLHQHHFLYLYKTLRRITDARRFEPVEIDSACNRIRVPHNRVFTRSFDSVEKLIDALSEDIINPDCYIAGDREAEFDDRSRVERIWIILHQLEFRRQTRMTFIHTGQDTLTQSTSLIEPLCINMVI